MQIFYGGAIDARNRPSKQVLPFWVNPKDISYYQIKLDLEGLGHKQEPPPLAMAGSMKNWKKTTQRERNTIQPFAFINPLVQPASRHQW